MARETLWERQRAAAREEISRTAIGLFLLQGFESTTIDQIVETVGVSRRSFFRYFGTKEDIVLGDLVARGEAVAALLSRRPADEEPWTALRRAFEESAETAAENPEFELALGRMLFETPSLRARFVEKRLRWQELLVPQIEPRIRGDGGAARLAASAIVASALACLDVASEEWVASDGATSLAELYDVAVASIRG